MNNVPSAISTCITEDPLEAAAYIQSGQIAAFPTETVYGLGGSVFDEHAIRAIFKAKERPADNPLIAHISCIEQIAELTAQITPTAQLLIDAFFPGPLAIVCRRHVRVPEIVSAGLDTLAIRMPAHDLALSFIDACGGPVAAPSANRSGRPSPTSWQDVYSDLKGRIPCILTGDHSVVGLESTVIDCTEKVPQLLRAGGISIEQVEAVTSIVQTTVSPGNGTARSPGMKYRHYAPTARVHVASAPEEVPIGDGVAFIGLTAHPYPEKLGMHLMCTTLARYGHELFRFFRRCDRASIQHIYCEAVNRIGLGLALMDRIEKASAG